MLIHYSKLIISSLSCPILHLLAFLRLISLMFLIRDYSTYPLSNPKTFTKICLDHQVSQFRKLFRFFLCLLAGYYLPTFTMDYLLVSFQLEWIGIVNINYLIYPSETFLSHLYLSLSILFYFLLFFLLGRYLLIHL